MAIYRERPREVEARQWTDANGDEIVAWLCEHLGPALPDGVPLEEASIMEFLHADVGDYIVRSANGAFAAMPAAAFDETFAEYSP